jgi:hypothetical protein
MEGALADDEDTLLRGDESDDEVGSAGEDAEEEREETAAAMLQSLNSFIAVGKPVLITMVRLLAKPLFFRF